MNNHFNDSIGEYTYFQHRIRYNFTNLYGDKGFIHTLMDKRGIDKEKVKSFKITELIQQSYSNGISTEHQYEDRIWMSREPLEKHSFGGVFCFHAIYLHETNIKTGKIIAELNKISSDYKDALKELNEDMKVSDGEAYHEAKDKVVGLEESIDTLISDLLNGFKGAKVVVVSSCSC